MCTASNVQWSGRRDRAGWFPTKGRPAVSCCEQERIADPTFLATVSPRWQQLVVDEATRQGGFALEVAKKFFAPYWGATDTLTLQGCAQFFGKTEHDIRHALDPVTSAAARQFGQSPGAAIVYDPCR